MSREMKDSGVEWIGEIPKDWEIIRAKNVFSYHKDIVGEKENEYERLSLTLNGVLKRKRDDSKGLQSESLSTYQILNKDELVFKMIDLENISTSRVGYSKYTGLVSPVYIIFNNSDYARFGYYYFYNMWQRAIFNQLGNNGVRSALNASDMLNLPFPKISKKEASKISNFLDEKVGEIDRLIDNAKKSIEEYKKYKQSIITEAVTKGLDPNVEMKDSGIEYLDEMPIHWNVVSISKIFMFIGGYAYKSEKFCQKTNYQVIRLGNVKNDELITDKKCVYINEQYAEESKKCKIKKDDILFTMTGTKGKKDYFFTLLVRESHLKNKNLYLNQRVGCFRKLNSNISMSYYNYLLKYEKIREYIFLHETGTANQGNIGIEDIKGTKVFLPPLEEQNKIVSYLDDKCFEIDNLIYKKEKLILELESYKKSIIYECVTGKKEV